MYAFLKRVHTWDVQALFGAVVSASFIEAGSLVAMFGTMGHAGPEGAFSIAGWFGVLVNFPGLLLGRFLSLGEDVSTTKLAIVLFLIQAPLLAYFFFVAIRAWRIRFGPEVGG